MVFSLSPIVSSVVGRDGTSRVDLQTMLGIDVGIGFEALLDDGSPV